MISVPHPYHLSSAEQCRRMDERTISEFGIDGFTLMEIAGTKAADFILSKIEPGSHGVFFCGKGNNAGDALVIARILSEKGHSVSICFVDGIEPLSKDTAHNLTLLKKLSGNITFIDWNPGLDFTAFNFVIDGMLGTGLNSDIRGPYDEVIELVNRCKKTIFALDIPTGLHPDTGRIMGSAINANFTITFGVNKVGFYINDGPDVSGKIVLCELPFPNHFREHAAFLINEEWVTPSHQKERRHKYDDGVVYIIAGSEGLSGAGILAAKSAWATGVGAVTLITPKGLLEIYEKNLVQIIKKPVGKINDTHFTESHLEEVLDLLKEKPGKLLIGPGLGRKPETIAFVQELLSTIEIDIVIDADALFALSQSENWNKPKITNWILTPHPGELKLLLGSDVSDDFDRLLQVTRKAKQENITILSKGFPGILASKEGAAYLTAYDTKVFSRAGFGDVLSGKVTGFWLREKSSEHGSFLALLDGKEKAERHILVSKNTLEPLDLI